MLQRLFSSRVRVKLLNRFITSPEGRFYIRELERLRGEDYKSVVTELHNLESFGLSITLLPIWQVITVEDQSIIRRLSDWHRSVHARRDLSIQAGRIRFLDRLALTSNLPR
ncbi:hypothetical protein M1O56_04460 [Dehalococcoidia bacterium]|nr:hypothetical protein [Dehalococcoidia bacterium]